MRRFQNILVIPLTARAEPPPALEEAFLLAESSGARLHIVDHLDAEPDSQRTIELQENLPELRAEMIQLLNDRLHDWTEGLPGPSAEVDVSTGHQPQAVAERVIRNGHDLVIIASDNAPESTSAARRILNCCPCPAWMIRPGYRGASVLAAIDPDQPMEQNRLILDLARSQAELHGGEVRVMHAWNVVGMDVFESTTLTGERRAQLAGLALAVETAHRMSFDRVLKEAGLTDASTHFVEGPEARSIHGLSVLYRADLVVMGAGHPIAGDTGLGSTAEQVLAETESSVLLVR